MLRANLRDGGRKQIPFAIDPKGVATGPAKVRLAHVARNAAQSCMGDDPEPKAEPNTR